MKYIVTVNGKKYEVDVEKGQATAAMIDDSAATSMKPIQNAAPVVNIEKTSIPSKLNLNISGEGEVLQAPIPGIVLDIKVQEGAAVKKGDILFIIEAMKMENEVLATKDSIVSKILVSKGTSLATGDVLAFLK